MSENNENSESTILPRPGIHINGLRNDLHPLRMAGLICTLLWKFGTKVLKNNVHVTNRHFGAFALVDLKDGDSIQPLVTALSDIDNVQNQFDLSSITNNPYHFQVSVRHSGKHRSKSRSKSRARKRQRREEAAAQAAKSASDQSTGGGNVSTASPPNFLPKSQLENNNIAPWLASTAALMGSKLEPVQSTTSQQSDPVSVSADSPSDSSDEVDTSAQSPAQSASKVISNTTVSSQSSENAPLFLGVNWNPDPTMNGPRAGGVSRLAAELNLGRSASDRGVQQPAVKKSTTTSTTGLTPAGQVSVTTSTPGTGTGMAIGFYQRGERIGRETRHSEFKQGGMAHKDRGWLQDTVGKYVCGFLNSGEGGTLYIGVDDNGVVTGISCTQSTEDSFRLLIDEALKNIEPPIFTDSYTVRFKPVMESNGRLSESLHVLEIEVKEIKQQKHLYDFRGNAYLRRDGSLQGPLKARQVQEWTRKMLERANSGSALRLQVREMSQQLESERVRNARMQARLEELQQHISEVKLERKKSKICAIM